MTRDLLKYLVIMTAALLFSSCAVLHKVQLSDIEHIPKNAKPVSIKISENTVNLEELGELARIAGSLGGARRAGQAADDALSAYSTLFQFGPRTGTPVFNEFYATDMAERLVKACPNGRLTNIVSVRETRSYPVVKGEIIRVDAYCIKRG